MLSQIVNIMIPGQKMFKNNRFFLSAVFFGFYVLVFSSASFAKSKPAVTFEYSGPAVSFEDIYQSPDDNDLKLNYARQQASKGDYISAAYVLEGMLYASPNWDTARLFYAILLAELDDDYAALFEFNLLKDRPLSVEHRAIVDAYRKKLEAE